MKDYLIVLKGEPGVSYIVEDVHETTTCSNNIYFRDDGDKIVAAVAKDGFSLIREVEKNSLNKVFM